MLRENQSDHQAETVGAVALADLAGRLAVSLRLNGGYLDLRQAAQRRECEFAFSTSRPSTKYQQFRNAAGSTAERYTYGMRILSNRSLVLVALALSIPAWAATSRKNYFDDPFVQVTSGVADCPVPAGPGITEAEMRTQAHSRAERGTSCYLSGRCRLPNSYLYDQEIIPRVRKAILADGRFADTSVWVEGQRRWVWIKGCVRSKAQSQALERRVRGIDDVEAVINELVIRKR